MGLVSTTPGTFGEMIFRKVIMTGHTLAECNKISSSSEGLCDLTDLDLSIMITMDTSTLGTLVVTLNSGEIELRQVTATNRTEQVGIW
eukprot:scaffold1152_cov65-Attheya_sp.AAC.2